MCSNVDDDFLELKARLDAWRNDSWHDVEYSGYAEVMVGRRGLTKTDVGCVLEDPTKLLGVEKQDTERYKACFKLSSKYNLVIILRLLDNNILRIITVIKTNKKWQKKLKVNP